MSKSLEVEVVRASGASSAAQLCCTPLARGPLGVEDAERAAGMFKALGDPVRLRLFSNIASAEGGEACVCDIQDVGVSQPTVSHHLKKLREASPEDIAQVPGIGMRTAGAIKEAVVRETR